METFWSVEVCLGMTGKSVIHCILSSFPTLIKGMAVGRSESNIFECLAVNVWDAPTKLLWLRARLTSRAQTATESIQDQFPDARGLQWTVHGQTLAFQKTDPLFIQVLFNNVMHWVTVEAVDDTTIRVYDSTNCRPNLSVQVQASSKMQTAKEQITFQLEKMQVQKGAVDCGLLPLLM